MENIVKNDGLVIPIYLDTNTLLDLLASIEGGFSVVDKITTRSTDSKTNELSAGGEFGIGSFFNIFKINFRGDAKKEKSQESGQENQTERYHTYGSLLNRLRHTLKDNGLKLITDEQSFQNVKTSDFIEVRGKFTPNPWRDSIKTISGLLDLITDVTKNGMIKLPNQEQVSNLRGILTTMLKDLEHESLQIFIVELFGKPQYKIVTSLFSEYIRDRSGRELPYGEFKLLGKITRKLGDGETIDLLKGSSFSAIGKAQIDQFSQIFKNLGDIGIKVPDLITEVKSPAIQVIPIAVYV